MYIFSRTTLAALGRQAEALPAAVAIGNKVSEMSGKAINTFTVHYGAPLGTIMWTATYENHVERQEMFDKLQADQAYLDAVEAMNGMFMTPAEDRIGRVLTGPSEATSRFYAVTRAAMTAGKYGEAIDFGVKIAEYIGNALDAPATFVKPSYGGFGDVTWIFGADAMADIDRFEEWQMTDAGYQEMVTSAGGLFVENSGHNSLVEKLN